MGNRVLQDTESHTIEHCLDWQPPKMAIKEPKHMTIKWKTEVEYDLTSVPMKVGLMYRLDVVE